MKFKLTTLFITITCAASAHAIPASQFLTKPTGTYHVGYQDYHWVNEQACPDPLYRYHHGDADYSDNNTKHCRELTARVYYPTAASAETGNEYYQPFIAAQQLQLRFIPGMTKDDVLQLNDIRTFTFANQPIVSDKQFPVILFAAGAAMPVQVYENVISDLASHGYIVVGFNSSFINLTSLPNGHVIQTPASATMEEVEKIALPAELQDLAFMNDIIQNQHNADSVFKAMDIKHVGVLGHSLGARMLADAAHQHPNWFTAGATLDIGTDTTGNSQKQFAIPFMHVISANRMMVDEFPVNFELGRDGYLVSVSPNPDDHDYSKHLNFSDFTTLQYTPAYKKAVPFMKKMGMDIVGDGDGVKIAKTINEYVVTFFDMYLRGEVNAKMKSCQPVTDDSYIQCG